MSAQKEISAALIKELRERTGVGMGKCKEALVSAHGDIDEAISILRKSGEASAVKKEGRATNEGMIAFARVGSTVAFVEGNAETDFVVRNEKFQQFLRNLAEEAAKNHPHSLTEFLAQPYSKEPGMTIDQARAVLVQAIGENIQLRRLQIIEIPADTSFAIYSHLEGKLVTAVAIQGSSGEEALAKDIAMHVAAAAPEYVDPSTVPEAVIAQEKEIAAGQIKGKPANIVDKIVEGKLNAFYDGICLLRQKFIKNDTMTIQQVVDARAKAINHPLTVTSFVRWSVSAS